MFEPEPGSRPPASSDGQEPSLPWAECVDAASFVATAEDQALLDAIRQLQQRQPGWGNAVVVLGLSLVLFVGIGAAVWSTALVAFLIPILLFHELGHYVAMRCFGYRNLRMFFIPLFGAAVSGRHYNVVGWKKIVVSLAGPVPGIVLGALLAFVALVRPEPWLRQAALFALLFNAWNLLPVLPLDGGWVAHGLLFSRHPLLDVGFRLVACLALLVYSVFSSTLLLGLIGGAMLLALPTTYRIALVRQQLQREGFAPGAADDDSIPAADALRIAHALRQRLPPTGLRIAHVAQFTLNVFEMLNAKPPGVLGTLLLGGTHLGAIVMAVVMLVVAAAGPHLGPDALSMMATAPRRPYELGSFRQHKEPASAIEEADVLWGHFDASDDAQTAFTALSREPTGGAELTLFGQTLLVAVPRGAEELRSRWRRTLSSHTMTYHAGPERGTVRLLLLAADLEKANGAVTQLTDYFALPRAASAIPPWTNVPLTAEQVQERRRFAERGKDEPAVEPAVLAERVGSDPTSVLRTNGGSVRHRFGLLSVEVDFERPDQGLPLLTEWLGRNGFSRVKYDVTVAGASSPRD